MALLELPLWRSALTFPGDPADQVLANLTALRQEVTPEGIDAHLMLFVGSLADRATSAPTFDLVKQHYQTLSMQGDANGMSGLIRLSDVENANLPFLATPSYRYQLDQFKELILSDGLGVILQKASTILTSGYSHTPPKGKPTVLKGSTDAISFIEQGMVNLTTQFRSTGVEGNFRHVADVFSRYQARVGKPASGIKTGFSQIDEAHDGFQPGDLALVLGYTGQMKSMFTLNVVYHAVVWYGHNAAIIPTEMSAKALQDSIAVMHCSHKKFSAGLEAVTYERLKRGQLTKAEEQLLQEAIHDLATCKDYGQFLYKEPEKSLTVGEIRRWAEQQDRTYPLSLLAIDYLGHIDPSVGGSALKESSVANITVRETKQFAMTFRKGAGLSIISPWQSNREGFKEAEKNGGKFTLRAMAWAPEAEKSADLVYYVYRDENMAQSNQLQVGNIKARDRKQLMTPFMVFAEPNLRIIEDIDPSLLYQSPVPVLT